jgi:hypothetical protein
MIEKFSRNPKVLIRDSLVALDHYRQNTFKLQCKLYQNGDWVCRLKVSKYGGTHYCGSVYLSLIGYGLCKVSWPPELQANIVKSRVSIFYSCKPEIKSGLLAC